jgi:hypothetical protein
MLISLSAFLKAIKKYLDKDDFSQLGLIVASNYVGLKISKITEDLIN